MFGNVELEDDEISWDFMLEAYEPLCVVLVAMIASYICLDRRSQGFPVGWGWTLQLTMEEGIHFSCGVCLLGHLYPGFPSFPQV